MKRLIEVIKKAKGSVIGFVKKYPKLTATIVTLVIIIFLPVVLDFLPILIPILTVIPILF